MTELTDLSLSEASDKIGAGEVSSLDLVEANLSAIEKTEPLVQAYANILSDEARAAAKRADAEIAAGDRRGPLHGIPIGIKDNIYTKGIVTESGSRVMAGFLPDHDATCVANLKQAGAVIIGKLRCHEFALGSNEPPTRSPWNLDCYPGGSSIGSGAAVTSRSSFGALGTDTGGSIRVPSSINNLVGMKASFGRVSIYGVVPVAWSLDHVGPMTRKVRDNALLLAGMAGYDPKDPTSAKQPVPDFCAELEAGVAGLRIGVERDYFFYDGLQDEIRASVEAVIAEYQQLGAEIIEFSLPELEITQDALFTIVLAECSTYHRKLIRQHSEKYDPASRAIVQLGELIPASHYLAAQQARSLYRTAINSAFREQQPRCDALGDDAHCDRAARSTVCAAGRWLSRDARELNVSSHFQRQPGGPAGSERALRHQQRRIAIRLPTDRARLRRGDGLSDGLRLRARARLASAQGCSGLRICSISMPLRAARDRSFTLLLRLSGSR